MQCSRHHAHVVDGSNDVKRSAHGSWNFTANSHDDVANGGVDGVVDGVKADAGVVCKVAVGEGEAVSAPPFALQPRAQAGPISSTQCGRHGTRP